MRPFVGEDLSCFSIWSQLKGEMSCQIDGFQNEEWRNEVPLLGNP